MLSRSGLVTNSVLDLGFQVNLIDRFPGHCYLVMNSVSKLKLRLETETETEAVRTHDFVRFGH